MKDNGEGGSKYPWGNQEWPGLKPDPGMSAKDYNKTANYDHNKLVGILYNIQGAHDALSKAREHLPKNIDPTHYGPPAGQQLAKDAQQASDHLQNGYTAFLAAWQDLHDKINATMAKNYSTEADNAHRIAQAQDWK